MINAFVPVMGSISTQPVNCPGEPVIYSPLLDSPSALWLPHRDIRTNSAIMVADLVGSVSGAKIMKSEIVGQEAFIDSDGNTVNTAGETWAVGQAYDQTGNGIHLPQSTAGQRPSILFNYKNGYPVFSFNGANSNNFVTSTAILNNAAKMTAISSCKLTTGATKFLFGRGTNSTARWGLAPRYATNIAYGVMANGQNSNGNFSFSDTNWNNWLLEFDGSKVSNETSWKIFLNNIQQSLTFSNTIPDTMFSGTEPFYYGSWGSTSYCITAESGGLALFSQVLSDFSKSQLQTYFSTH